ncbi:MAG: hypothetical protein ACFFBH_00115 [Promethearchaeota archaeon]
MSSQDSEKKYYVPFIGLLEDYVGRSPLDYYSWGHIAFGIASFTIFSLIINLWELFIGPAPIHWYYLLIFVIIVAVVWEIIENTILWKLGLKYENRRDSFINALFDIIFMAIGGATSWLLKWIIMNIIGALGRFYYLAALILFIFVLIAYFIGFYITNENTKNARQEHQKIIS